MSVQFRLISKLVEHFGRMRVDVTLKFNIRHLSRSLGRILKASIESHREQVLEPTELNHLDNNSFLKRLKHRELRLIMNLS